MGYRLVIESSRVEDNRKNQPLNSRFEPSKKTRSDEEEEFYKNFYDWCQWFLPEMFHLESPPHQREWMDRETLFQNQFARHDWVTAFRGSSKTTIFAIAAPLWRICEQMDKYLIWISSTKQEAYNRCMKPVMDMLETNERIIEEYGMLSSRNHKIKPWGAELAETTTGIYLGAYGIRSVARGQLRGTSGLRPSRIHCDDISVEENQDTPLQRKKIEDKLDNVVLKLGPPDGSATVIGLSTPQHLEGIEAHVKKQASWDFIELPGIIREADNRKLWSEWRKIYINLRLGAKRKDAAKEFYLKNKAEMDKGSKVAWPEMQTYYQYMVARVENQASFAQEIGLPLPIGLRPLDPSQQKLPTETCSLFRIEGWKIIFTRGPRAERNEVIDARTLDCYGFLDPAVGEKPTNDYSAITRIGVDEYGQKYVLEIWAEVADKGTYLQKYIDMHQAWPFVVAGFEANQFQKYLGEDLEGMQKDLMEDGLISKSSILPIQQIINTEKKLPRMVSYLQTPMINHFLAFNEFIVYSKPYIWTQFQNLGTSDHDDCPDSAASNLKLMATYGI